MTPRTAATGALLLALVGPVACGRQPPAPASRGLSAITVAEARSNHYRSVPWTLIDVEPDGREIRIGYSFGGCQPRPGAVAVTVDPTTVTLTLFAPPPAGGSCTPTLGLGSGTVRLSHPVAGPALRHAAVTR